MNDTFNLNWIEKLKVECIEEDGGGLNIHIEWDEKDPDLEYWTSLSEEGQKNFMIDALYNALLCDTVPKEH
jgi:hypothetical protein